MWQMYNQSEQQIDYSHISDCQCLLSPHQPLADIERQRERESEAEDIIFPRINQDTCPPTGLIAL